MATVTPELPSRGASSDIDFDGVIARRLQSFARRRRRLLIARGTLAALAVFIVAMLVVALCDYLWFLSEPARLSLSLSGYLLAVAAAWWFGLGALSESDARVLARQMESLDPRFADDLLSAVELADPRDRNGSPVFLERLQRSVARQITTVDPRRLLPLRLLRQWLLTGGAMLLMLALLSLIPSLQFPKRMARAMLPGIPVQRVSRTEITIVSPSPPSRAVAQGDAVGVVVRTDGEPVDEVRLQWLDDSGNGGEVAMAQRGDDEFAANLPIGEIPLDYRVRGGDGITLWQRLTPRPRPQATHFAVRYRFPKYTGLEPKVEEADHGDLRALAGTYADVTVSFDQPVDDAVMRFDGGRYELRLQPVGEDATAYQAELPIRTPASYSVDSVSRSSGLSNPFSPRYTITPVTDTPPVVRWNESLPESQLVSPIDLLRLSAQAVDDLPMDEAQQQFSINGEKWQSRDVPVEAPTQQWQSEWTWDLAELQRPTDGESDTNQERKAVATGSELINLAPGDVVRTRVVIDDRRGNRGESGVIELLVADEGFARDRHERMRAFADWVTNLVEWTASVDALVKLATEHPETPPEGYYAALVEGATEAREPVPALVAELKRFVSETASPSEAGRLQLIGSGLAEIDRRLAVTTKIAVATVTSDGRGSKEVIPADWKDAVNHARQLEKLSKLTQQLSRSQVGHEMTLAVTTDAHALLRSIESLVDPERVIPDDRWPRFLGIALERLREIGRLIEEQKPVLAESTVRQFGQWSNWSESWESRLQLAMEEFPGRVNTLASLNALRNELRDRIGYAIFDANNANSLRESTDQLLQNVGSHASLVEQLRATGAAWERWRQVTEKETDSEKASEAASRSHRSKLEYTAAAAALPERLVAEESLERTRAVADLRYAADLVLARRAIENVTGEGFVAYQDEPADAVHVAIAQSLGRLEGVHLLTRTKRELTSLLEAQERLQDDATTRFSHAAWLEQIQIALHAAERTMQSAGVPWEQIAPFANLRYNDAASRAGEQLAQRRYSVDPPVPVIPPLRENSETLTNLLGVLEPIAAEARRTLMKYVLSLPDQARKAAEQAEAAAQQVSGRDGSTPQSQQSIEPAIESAAKETQETIRALVDLANTSETHDPEERELVRDADAAALQLNQAAREVERAMDNATTAPSDRERAQSLDLAATELEALQDTLQKTADHFEDAMAGADVTESRQALREAEADLRAGKLLQERFENADKMAERLNSDPAEMLRQLEHELPRNEPMQDELDQIAEQTGEAAQRLLSRAVKEEESVQTSLERADSAFDERKQRVRDQVRAVARRAAAIDRSLLNAIERASQVGQTDAVEPETREQLTRAAAKADGLGASAPLAEMQQTAAELAAAIEAARGVTEKLSQKAAEQAGQKAFDDDRKRVEAAKRLAQLQQQARDQRVRDARDQKNFWTDAKTQARRREQQAQQRAKEAKNQTDRAEKELKKKPEEESLQRQLAESRSRAERAAATAEQAKQTQDLAEAQEKELEARGTSIKNTPLVELKDQPNPAAQLLTALGRDASTELEQLDQALDQVAQQAQFSDSLQVPDGEASALAKRQTQLNQDVGLAAEMLARAARHQQRLGNAEQSAQLDRAAADVAQVAESVLPEAAEALSATAEEAASAPRAGQALAEAKAALAEQAGQLADMLAAQSPAPNSSPAQDSAEPTPAQKLARTLDELDQALHQPQSDGSAGDAPQPADSQAGNQPSQVPGKPSTAGQASSTLAQAASAQAQRQARQRSSQAMPGNPGPSGAESAPPADSSGTAGSPATQSGAGTMASGEGVSTDGVVRAGEDWGQLRERRTDDAVEDRAAQVAPGYRREVEAYFRAIAERAVQK